MVLSKLIANPKARRIISGGMANFVRGYFEVGEEGFQDIVQQVTADMIKNGEADLTDLKYFESAVQTMRESVGPLAVITTMTGLASKSGIRRVIKDAKNSVAARRVAETAQEPPKPPLEAAEQPPPIPKAPSGQPAPTTPPPLPQVSTAAVSPTPPAETTPVSEMRQAEKQTKQVAPELSPGAPGEVVLQPTVAPKPAATEAPISPAQPTKAEPPIEPKGEKTLPPAAEPPAAEPQPKTVATGQVTAEVEREFNVQREKEKAVARVAGKEAEPKPPELMTPEELPDNVKMVIRSEGAADFREPARDWESHRLRERHPARRGTGDAATGVPPAGGGHRQYLAVDG